MKKPFFLLLAFFAVSTASRTLLSNDEGFQSTSPQKDTSNKSSNQISITNKQSNRTTTLKKKKKFGKATRKKRRCRSFAKPRYRRMVRRWQIVPKIPKPRYREGFRDLTIYGINHGERVRVFPYLEDGTLDPEANVAFERVFRDKDTDAQHVVHPRLIMLLYRLADRFKARQINLISGYRESVAVASEGNHSRGRAADIMVPGVPLAVVARFARSMGHVGVGLYPASGFIHLDIRDGPSYFWVDRSGPGQRSCHVRIGSKLAAKHDRRWKPKHDEPRVHVNRKGEPLGARGGKQDL